MRRRGGYEILPDENELQNLKLESNLRNKSWLIVLAVVVAVGITTHRCSSNANDPILGENHKHTIPTLLSVVHHETGDYVMALENPLYERIKQATFLRYDVIPSEESISIVESPTLHVDRVKMGVREPITLSWTLGKDELGKNVLKDDDIIMLFCDNQVAELGQSHFLEAATIAQARATSQRHGQGRRDQDSQQWHIPSFSVLRKEFCQFHLYKAMLGAVIGNPNYALLDTSPVVQIDDSRSVPTGIHLALSNDPSVMVVQFTTGDQQGTPVAQYSKIGGDSKKASGTSHTYTAKDMCEAPANITEAGKFQDPGILHIIRLTDLEPNTEYEYKVGLARGQGITWSDSFSFLSAQPAGDPATFRYLVYGDQGCPSVGWGDGGKWVAAMTAREVTNPKDNLPIRAVHHFGDLSYARGAGHVWDEWLNMISHFTAKVPLMVGVGNHEYDHESGGGNGKDPSGVLLDDGYRPIWGNFNNDSGGECGIPTSNYFAMPNSTKSNGVYWYSFDFGSVHTIVLSSEHDMSPGSRLYNWLVMELKSIDRSITPWVILEMHRPMYEAQMNWAENAVGIARRMELEDLLTDYNVDLVLAGHYHAYFRSCDGLRSSKCNNGGPMHITVGTAGAILTELDLYPNTWTGKYIKGEFGYGRITVANASALLFEFVKAGDENDTTAGEVHDSVWIRRERTTPSVLH